VAAHQVTKLAGAGYHVLGGAGGFSAAHGTPARAHA
jgi:hypothetical protein